VTGHYAITDFGGGLVDGGYVPNSLTGTFDAPICNTPPAAAGPACCPGDFDAGSFDAGHADAGHVDAGGVSDSGAKDGGDASLPDGGALDAGCTSIATPPPRPSAAGTVVGFVGTQSMAAYPRPTGDVGLFTLKGPPFGFNDPSPFAEATGDLSAYSRSDGFDSIVFRRADGNVWELSHGAQWGLASPAILAGAPAAAGAPSGFLRSDGVNSIVYRTAAGHVEELELPSGAPGWSARDLFGIPINDPSPIPAAGDPIGYERGDGVNAVVYVTPGGHVAEISWGPTYSGFLGDLSSLVGATVGVAGRPHAYVRGDHTSAVVYRGTDGHVYEISLAPCAGRWTLADLSKESGAPPAAGDPVGYVRGDAIDAVVYRGADANLYEIRRVPGSGWLAADLTLRAGAPTAAGTPGAFTTPDGSSHVLFESASNGHVEESVLAGGAWTTIDLTAATGSAP
jgi:hypothetical protein